MTSLKQLTSPHETSVSIITPPHVTLDLLDQARELGIPNLWLQPGSFDSQVMTKVKELDGILNVIAQGRCILVEGSEDLAIAVAHGGRKL